MRPKWQGAFEGWSRNWVRQNFWRVDRIFQSPEDALQQCAMVFARCLVHYEGTVDNEAWFMALYKRALANHWYANGARNIANKEIFGDPHELEALKPAASLYQDEEEALPGLDGAVEIWESASGELRQVLSMIANGPAELVEILTEDCPRLNQRWRRFGRIKAQKDLVGEMRELLAG